MWLFFSALPIWNFSRIHYSTPPAGLVCARCPVPKRADTKLVLTGFSEKDGADILYQTLLELLTRPSEMRCIDCRQRALCSWNKKDETRAAASPSQNVNNALCSHPRLSSPHTQTVKQGLNAVSPRGLRIGQERAQIHCLNKTQEVCYWPGDDKLDGVLVCIFSTVRIRCCAYRGTHAGYLDKS